MKLNRFTKGLVIALTLLVSANVFAELRWLDKIIVLVEDDVILDSELERRVLAVTSQIKASGQSVPPLETIQKQVIEQLILESVQLQRARRAGVRISDEELNAAMQRIAEGNQITIDQLRNQLATDGIDFAIFREDIREDIMISRARQGLVNQRVFVSDQEVDDVLKLIEDQGQSNIQYKLRHLLIAIPESAGANQIDEARDKAQSIIKRFKEGTDFVSMVLSESDGSDALQGGDLGWRTVEQLPTLFADSVVSMTKNEITGAIRSPNGLHILWLEDSRGGIEAQLVDEINVRHILIEVSAVTSDAKAEAQLLEIRKQILAGETTFEEQAKVYSEDLSSASNGGDLGWAPPQAFERIYGDNARQLEVGDLSQPIKTSRGWYLVEVLGSRQTDQTDEMKRSRARQVLFRRKFDEEQEAWLREIRDSAYVKILDDRLK